MLSKEEIKRQKEAAAKSAKNKKDAEARRAASLNTTRTRMRAEAESKAAKEKERLTRQFQIKSIWGGGNAARKQHDNDMRYVEAQRVKRQDAITNAQNKTKPAAKPEAKPAPKPQPKPAPKPAATPQPAAAPPAPAPLRSPAIGAPVHAKPQDFGAAAVQPSAFAPQVGQAPRPNAPQPAMSPQYGGNDEPGRMGQNENGYQMPQQPQAPAAGGPDANGIDMERRRAFLDADNSLDGLKAVKDLLNRRKLSISVEN